MVGDVVDLEHRGDRALEEGTVVRHDRNATRDRRHELLEAIEPREVEVVGRFVEQEHVEAREEDRSEGHTRGLAARERRRALVERVGRQPDVGEDHADPGVEVGATEREPPFERDRVQVVRALVARGERIRRPARACSASVTPVRRWSSARTVSPSPRSASWGR